MAAETGHANANFVLGIMYLEGSHVPENQKMAVDHFRISAEAGHPQATEFLREIDARDSCTDASSSRICRDEGLKLVCKESKQVSCCHATKSEDCKVALRVPHVRPDDFEAGIAASIQEASDKVVFENARISERLVRSCVPNSIEVVILEFSQHGEWFLKALTQSAELSFIRQPLLPSGAKVYVSPDEAYEQVKSHLQQEQFDLKPRHVVVRKEHVELVISVIDRAVKDTPRRKRGGSSCKVRKQPLVMSIPASASQCSIDYSGLPDYIVKRTFVCVTQRSSMYSGLSTHAHTA
mmetsp:Transcript_24065/g.44657  ORF Transcript_24065/g.44657 Transcript_24065/m.44657 type:complete len:294 (+) Transcript_24065:1-882(+)